VLQRAWRLDPGDFWVNFDLGDLHWREDHFARPEEATRFSSAAVAIRPRSSVAHNNLGLALLDQGKLEEAIAEIRAALRLKPDFFQAHLNLGVALSDQGKVEEAIAEFRVALRLQPDYAEAHCNLGCVLRRQGRFAESLAEYKRGHELSSKNPNWRYPSAQWVKQVERMVELDGKLPAILSGRAKPADAQESLVLAQMCYDKKLQGAAARLWENAFETQSLLADDLSARNRYNAACAAAMAGAGQGKDDPPLDEAAKARWRKQAIDWLKADLAEWSKLLASGPSQVRQSISQTLQHWKADSDLAGLREEAALAKLPDDGRTACRALWAEVDALLKKARDAKP
jgi:tetratricopeptide (TPR) repeat protein